MFEMYRRNQFRQDLVSERCEELTDLEGRLQELDSLLTLTTSGRGGTRCACGAPILWGAHFCSNCGRAVGAPVVACPQCQTPLAADARYCTACGTPIEHGDAAASSAAAPEPVAADVAAQVPASGESER